jgi:hypothetical protein
MHNKKASPSGHADGFPLDLRTQDGMQALAGAVVHLKSVPDDRQLRRCAVAPAVAHQDERGGNRISPQHRATAEAFATQMFIRIREISSQELKYRNRMRRFRGRFATSWIHSSKRVSTGLKSALAYADLYPSIGAYSDAFSSGNRLIGI